MCNAHGGILTPNLEKMAAQGVTLTNFHTASPVCSPSRVSIMTGLYPWRLGALNAFELGRDNQRNMYLPQITTGAEILRQHGYYTGHSGKWHMGMFREEYRRKRVLGDECMHPGPNQHGFEDYISELDGPESARFTFLHSGQSNLHLEGYKYLLKNDVPMPTYPSDSDTHYTKTSSSENGDNYQNPPEVLSDREANDAIRMIEKVHQSNSEQPWFLQVMFNAPHSPWTTIPQVS